MALRAPKFGNNSGFYDIDFIFIGKRVFSLESLKPSKPDPLPLWVWSDEVTKRSAPAPPALFGARRKCDLSSNVKPATWSHRLNTAAPVQCCVAPLADVHGGVLFRRSFEISLGAFPYYIALRCH
jgi:hypothetical protein